MFKWRCLGEVKDASVQLNSADWSNKSGTQRGEAQRASKLDGAHQAALNFLKSLI